MHTQRPTCGVMATSHRSMRTGRAAATSVSRAARPLPPLPAPPLPPRPPPQPRQRARSLPVRHDGGGWHSRLHERVQIQAVQGHCEISHGTSKTMGRHMGIARLRDAQPPSPVPMGQTATGGGSHADPAPVAPVPPASPPASGIMP